MQGIKVLAFDTHRTLVLRTAGLLCPAGLLSWATGTAQVSS